MSEHIFSTKEIIIIIKSQANDLRVLKCRISGADWWIQITGLILTLSEQLTFAPCFSSR